MRRRQSAAADFVILPRQLQADILPARPDTALAHAAAAHAGRDIGTSLPGQDRRAGFLKTHDSIVKERQIVSERFFDNACNTSLERSTRRHGRTWDSSCGLQCRQFSAQLFGLGVQGRQLVRVRLHGFPAYQRT